MAEILWDRGLCSSSRRGSASRVWDCTGQQHQNPDPGRGLGQTEVAKRLLVVDQINQRGLDIEAMASNWYGGERAM